MVDSLTVQLISVLRDAWKDGLWKGQVPSAITLNRIEEVLSLIDSHVYQKSNSDLDQISGICSRDRP